ncbi:hypothetical protein CDV31_014123 [Fusarium ambrosium]|uniref:Uncharacterized protein n=1 Tax=Fusarium ambrosium TaxID=131363 RepID=A0A428SZ00_9HYPO|nr:hypothetical protein CDV31_014123 [Fusarium ambrosium]
MAESLAARDTVLIGYQCHTYAVTILKYTHMRLISSSHIVLRIPQLFRTLKEDCSSSDSSIDKHHGSR